MCGAVAGNWKASLGPGGSELRVRVHDAADRWKLTIQRQVRGKIRRGIESSFDHLAVKVGDDEVSRLELVIRYAAGLDRDQAFGAIDAAGVAEEGWRRGPLLAAGFQAASEPFGQPNPTLAECFSADGRFHN